MVRTWTEGKKEGEEIEKGNEMEKEKEKSKIFKISKERDSWMNFKTVEPMHKVLSTNIEKPFLGIK